MPSNSHKYLRQCLTYRRDGVTVHRYRHPIYVGRWIEIRTEDGVTYSRSCVDPIWRVGIPLQPLVLPEGRGAPYGWNRTIEWYARWPRTECRLADMTHDQNLVQVTLDGVDMVVNFDEGGRWLVEDEYRTDGNVRYYYRIPEDLLKVQYVPYLPLNRPIGSYEPRSDRYLDITAYGYGGQTMLDNAPCMAQHGEHKVPAVQLYGNPYRLQKSGPFTFCTGLNHEWSIVPKPAVEPVAPEPEARPEAAPAKAESDPVQYALAGRMMDAVVARVEDRYPEMVPMLRMLRVMADPSYAPDERADLVAECSAWMESVTGTVEEARTTSHQSASEEYPLCQLIRMRWSDPTEHMPQPTTGDGAIRYITLFKAVQDVVYDLLLPLMRSRLRRGSGTFEPNQGLELATHLLSYPRVAADQGIVTRSMSDDISSTFGCPPLRRVRDAAVEALRKTLQEMDC